MENELILVLDFGGQYKQLIARRVRECGVWSKIIPGNTSVEAIQRMHPIGIILTGGQPAFMMRHRRNVQKKYWTWAYRFWGFAMDIN